MKKGTLQLSILYLFFSLSVKAQCQTRTYFDSTSMIDLWKDATIKNINYQLSLNQVIQSDSFYRKILLSAKEFIDVQSQDNGLRESFYNKVLKQSDHFLQSDHSYVVEHYNSGEGFSAVISLYTLGTKDMQYIYKLNFGKWVLEKSKEVRGNAVDSVFSKTDHYICDEYYAAESIIITCFSRKEVKSKAFLFPCSTGFKELNKTCF